MRAPLRLGLIALALVAIAGANWSSWAGGSASAPARAAAADPAWDAFAAIACAPGGNTFPAALAAREGTTMTLTGVLLVPPQLAVDGRLDGALLAPPSRFSCCGLACDARPQLLVFVEPAQATPAPKERRLCTVTGTLRLHRDGGGWSATTLAAASLRWQDDPTP